MNDELNDKNEPEDMDELDECNELDAITHDVFAKALTTTLNEVIEAASRDISNDPEYPDTPPKAWQVLFHLLHSDRVLNAMLQEFRSRIFQGEE